MLSPESTCDKCNSTLGVDVIGVSLSMFALEVVVVVGVAGELLLLLFLLLFPVAIVFGGIMSGC